MRLFVAIYLKADEVGLMTSYFHFIFTSLVRITNNLYIYIYSWLNIKYKRLFVVHFLCKDIGIINFAPPANITAIQIFRPNDQVVKNLIAEWNLKNIFQKKPIMTDLPVCL